MILLFTKVDSNTLLLLDYTYVINRHIYQNYTINEHLINNYDLQVILNGTSNEYDLQSSYNGNGCIGSVTSLQQVCSAIYDTNAQPFVYTDNEHIDITYSQISLNLPIEINNEIVLNPRAYDHAVVEMISGTDKCAFRQNTTHGGQPIVQFYPSTKACTFHGDCEVPNMCNKTYVDILIAGTCTDICRETTNIH